MSRIGKSIGLILSKARVQPSAYKGTWGIQENEAEQQAWEQWQSILSAHESLGSITIAHKKKQKQDAQIPQPVIFL